MALPEVSVRWIDPPSRVRRRASCTILGQVYRVNAAEELVKEWGVPGTSAYNTTARTWAIRAARRVKQIKDVAASPDGEIELLRLELEELRRKREHLEERITELGGSVSGVIGVGETP